jgi:hypothetical protein
MKRIIYLILSISLALYFFVQSGCAVPDSIKSSDSSGNGGGNTNVVFQSAVQTGGTSGTADSTGLTLTFDVDPTTLTADNIAVTGATKSALTGTGTTRSLAISSITVPNGQTVSVAITSPTGYSISGSPQTAVVYRVPVSVSFQSAVQIGGTSATTDSTGLTLTFDVDPATLTADNITVTGATKGALTGGGTTWDLAISNITVDNGTKVSISITSPAGYSITGSPQTAVVYRAPYIGMAYQGGIVFYIFQSYDPGFVSGETHGLIAATADQSTGIQWALPAYCGTAVPGGTGTALRTGLGNTINIVGQNDVGTTYAAGIARAYNGGGFTDWYLPSKVELEILYLNKAYVDGFADDWYWSSTEYDASKAWVRYSYNYIDNKLGLHRVRAIRAF